MSWTGAQPRPAGRITTVDVADQRLSLWKFDTGKWPDRQVVVNAAVTSWLAALDDFRNWLIREAA